MLSFEKQKFVFPRDTHTNYLKIQNIRFLTTALLKKKKIVRNAYAPFNRPLHNIPIIYVRYWVFAKEVQYIIIIEYISAGIKLRIYQSVESNTWSGALAPITVNKAPIL